MSKEQLYVLSLRKMCIDRKTNTTVATAWSTVVARSSLSRMALADAACMIDVSYTDEQAGLDPMTVTEVDEWIKDDHARTKRK